MCNLSPWYVAHHGDHLRGGWHTSEIVSAVSCTPLRWSLWYVAHYGDHLRSVLHTAVRLSLWCAQRSSLRCDAHSGNNLEIKYLYEIETEFENTLACLSWAQMGSNHEKNWRLKILLHTPFKIENLIVWLLFEMIPRDQQGNLALRFYFSPIYFLVWYPISKQLDMMK